MRNTINNNPVTKSCCLKWYTFKIKRNNQFKIYLIKLNHNFFAKIINKFK